MRKLGSISLLVILICLGCIVALALVFLSQNRVVANQFPLRQKWVFETDDQIRSTPVIHKGQVFVRTNDKLYVVNGSTGDLSWSLSLPNDWSPAPVLAQDDIVIVTHSKGTIALSSATGELLWEALDSNTRSVAFPAASNDEIVVIVNEAIFIRDIRTGELLWKIENPHSRSRAIVALGGKYLYVVFRDQIHSYDIETRSLLWNDSTEKWSLKHGLIEDGILYIERLEEGIAAYSLEEQRILWQRKDILLADYPPTRDEDVLFIGTRGAPIGVNALTGETLWEADGLWSYDNYQTPLIFNDTVYIRGLFKESIYALNRDNGQLRGYISLGVPDIISANADYSLGPVRFDESIIFPTGNKLLAYEE